MTAPADAEAAEAARFLRVHPPFAALPESAVALAAATQLQRLPAQTTVFAQGDGPLEHLWVIRDGAVEVVADGRVLDLLGSGELFGHASMLSGLPPGFEARAAARSSAGWPPRAELRGAVSRGGRGGIRVGA